MDLNNLLYLSLILLFWSFSRAGITTMVLGYVLLSTMNYALFRKAGVPHAWLAWLPLAWLWPFMWTIKKSTWNIIWLCIPFINVFFMIYFLVRLFKAFGVNRWWLLILLVAWIPVIGWILGAILFIIQLMMSFG